MSKEIRAGSRTVALAVLLSALATPVAGWDDAGMANVAPGYVLTFPRDHGSHPDFRTEWWYVTGWLQDRTGRLFGFQVTFFRTRADEMSKNPSAFTPRHLLFAHAALAVPELGHLIYDERAAREGLGVAFASNQDTDVALGGWRLRRDPARGSFLADVVGEQLAIHLAMSPSSAPLAHGENGYRQTGAKPGEASEYYSLVQLAVAGQVTIGHKQVAVTGIAWLDHEWSSTLLAPDASGWDWVGINLDDGGALMAFRIRDRKGKTQWAGATLRHANGEVERFEPSEIAIETLRSWRSPRTATTYPIELAINVGQRRWRIAPFIDDQEIDARRSTGTVYWEGAVTASADRKGASTDGVAAGHGRGYLELTGYDRPLML